MKKILVLSFLVFTHAGIVDACTRAFFNQSGIKVVGRSFDWETHYQETLKVLPRGKLHRGGAEKDSAQWYSKYGSIVIQENHQGQKAITDGVNEAGLAAHLLSFEDGIYQPRNLKKPGLSILQWLQYYLDNFATVDAVVKHIDDVQIVPADFAQYHALPLHVAIEDQSGDSAIIEFVQGQLTIHHGKAYTILTNEPEYSRHLKNWDYFEKNGCPKAEIPLDDQPESRFIRAACYLQALSKPKTGDQAVAWVASIMENASVPYGMSTTEVTWWRTIIDFSSHRYYVKSTRVPTTFWINYDQVDFGQQSAYRQINIHDSRWQGNITNLFFP